MVDSGAFGHLCHLQRDQHHQQKTPPRLSSRLVGWFRGSEKKDGERGGGGDSEGGTGGCQCHSCQEAQKFMEEG